MLDRAAGRGEIPADTDYEVVLDLLFGAAYHRLLQGHQPLTDRFARAVVDLVVAGIQNAGGAPRRDPHPGQSRARRPPRRSS